MSSTGVGTTQAPFCTTACQTDVDAVQNAAGDSTGDLPESALPREFRSRLHKMFERIERDFEREYQKVIAENYARRFNSIYVYNIGCGFSSNDR